MAKASIHQIYYRADQLAGLEDAFIPFDNSRSERPDLYEFFVFRQEYLAGRIPETGFCGYVSWKFKAKTQISGTRFLTFLKENPGFDVYFIHPFPIDLSMGNVWAQGEYYHPGLKKLADHIFKAAGYSIKTDDIPANLRISAACNYWTGNKKFWDAYMQFCLPLYDYVTKEMTGPEKDHFYSQADPHSKSSYFAYIFERLFTTFLFQNPEIKACSYTYSTSELETKYSPPEAALVNRMQELEAAEPTLTEPIKSDHLLMAGLHFYFRYKYEVEFRTAGFLLTKGFWKALPMRGRLLRHRYVRRLKHYVQKRSKLTITQ